MSTPARDFHEILARIRCGVAGAREADQLADLVHNLTWKPTEDLKGRPVLFCRHCGLPQDPLDPDNNLQLKAHAHWCPAKEVD